MTRLIVFAVALVAILGFALLTAYIFEEHGVTVGGIISVAVLLFLSISLLGALLGGPRD